MRKWKKILAAFLATALCVSVGFGSTGGSPKAVYAASSTVYPVQKFRIVIGDSDRNINISGFGDKSPLNSWITNGEENEKWYLEYQSEGVYKIINARTDKAITADNGRCTIDAVNNESNQLWKIIGIEKDFNGDDLFYKIVSYENENMAITFKPQGNKVVLEEFNQGEYQKFKINCDGLEGFAGNCQVAEGEKAATVGGLFGETVFVDTLEELKNALVEDEPLTIVLTANIDCSGENYDWRIEDNKTLIGSYDNNQLMDCKLRTNDYFEEEEPSDNIIVRNIRFQIEKNKCMMAFAIYSSRNIWIDHCDFNCEFTKEYDEVGKFIWINTPFSGKDIGRSPDFMTFSYNTFSNRYWGIAFGTQNEEVDKDRATMIYNVFDSIVQRAPQMGNGTLHVMNNYYVRKTTSIDEAGMEQIKCGANSKIYSVANRFEGFKKESSGYWDKELTVYADSVITDVDSYTDKTENGGGTPYKISISTDHIENTEKPEENYGYKVLSAYNEDGTNDVKAFCQTYSGCVKSGNPVYITDSSVSGFVTRSYTAPFIQTLEVSQEEETTENITTTAEPTTKEVTSEEETTTELTTEEVTSEEGATTELTTEEVTSEEGTTTELTTEEATSEEETTTELTTEEGTNEEETTTELTTETSTEEKTYNYGTALQKSLIFYELQKSGKLDGEEFNRNNWRGDSCLNDGQDVGLDLTGGWFDAGDTMKFNLPMSYTATTLAWSYLENEEAYEKAGQTKYLLNSVKWANDYFIKCHPEENVYYYQVGDVKSDHDYWGAAETVEARMERPSYHVDNTSDNGGSTVCGETAASLAACAIVFKEINPEYSATCLQHAKEILLMAEEAKSDQGYTAAKDCYDSWSGFYDELSWANLWLYKATGESTYLEKAKEYTAYWGTDSSGEFDYKEGQCWDDVHYGAALMIAQYDSESEIGKKCKRNVENNLDWWKAGATKMSPEGQAWLTEWSSLAYSTTSAFLAMMYIQWDGADPDRIEAYEQFAKSQADYALGSSGQCFQVGYEDEESPRNVHHATAHGTWTGELEEPERSRHLLVGALVGGPRAADDQYTDDRSDYYSNEVACDYNAGFTGLMAALYEKYGQKEEIDPNAGAYEEVDEIEELSIEAGIYQQDENENWISIKAVVCNKTAWPAQVTDKLTYRYFVDIHDVLENGGSVEDISVYTDYNSGNAVASALKPWDEEKGIYYTEVDLTGIALYPGGEGYYNNEMFFRISANKTWDYTKSPSFKGLEATTANSLVKAVNMALYNDGKIVFGIEPDKGTITTEELKSETTQNQTTEWLTTELTTEQLTTENGKTEEQSTEQLTSEQLVTEKITTEKVTTNEQITEERTTERLTTERETTNEPTTEELTTEKATMNKPTTEALTTEKATTNKPTTERLTTEKITTNERTTERLTTEKVTTNEATTEQLTTEKITNEPTTKELTTEKITTNEATTEKLTTEKATTNEPTTEKLTTEKVITNEPTTEELTTEKATTNKPTTERLTTEKITTNEPTTERLTTEKVTTNEPTTKEWTTEKVTTNEATTEKVTTNEATTERLTTEKVTTEMVTTEKTPVYVEKITITPAVAELVVGDTKELVLNIFPTNAENQKVRWSSTNADVVTVDQNGKITAVKAGQATIIVITEDEREFATCQITVQEKQQSTTQQSTTQQLTTQSPTTTMSEIKVEKVKVKEKSFTLDINKTKTIKTVVYPANATNKKVTYASSNKTVATVDASGKVKAMAPGIANITIKAASGVSTKVTVKVKPAKVTAFKKTKLSKTKVKISWKK